MKGSLTVDLTTNFRWGGYRPNRLDAGKPEMEGTVQKDEFLHDSDAYRTSDEPNKHLL